MPEQQLTLAQRIDRFIADSHLVHEFVKGDETVIVHGEAGDYPSLAKIAADAATLIATILHNSAGLRVMKFDFTDQLQLVLPHGAGTKHYTMKITNSAGHTLYAPEEPIDDDTIVVDFTEPESGVAIVTLYTAL